MAKTHTPQLPAFEFLEHISFKMYNFILPDVYLELFTVYIWPTNTTYLLTSLWEYVNPRQQITVVLSDSKAYCICWEWTKKQSFQTLFYREAHLVPVLRAHMFSIFVSAWFVVFASMVFGKGEPSLRAKKLAVWLLIVSLGWRCCAVSHLCATSWFQWKLPSFYIFFWNHTRW